MNAPDRNLRSGAYFLILFADNVFMGYFNYHATAKRLIKSGKLIDYRFVTEYNGIKDVLLLIFDDAKHPVMPIRKPRQKEYMEILKIYKNP